MRTGPTRRQRRRRTVRRDAARKAAPGNDRPRRRRPRPLRYARASHAPSPRHGRASDGAARRAERPRTCGIRSASTASTASGGRRPEPRADLGVARPEADRSPSARGESAPARVDADGEQDQRRHAASIAADGAAAERHGSLPKNRAAEVSHAATGVAQRRAWPRSSRPASRRRRCALARARAGGAGTTAGTGSTGRRGVAARGAARDPEPITRVRSAPPGRRRRAAGDGQRLETIMDAGRARMAGMDFDLSDDHELIRRTVRDFAEQRGRAGRRGARPREALPLRDRRQARRARADGHPVPRGVRRRRRRHARLRDRRRGAHARRLVASRSRCARTPRSARSRSTCSAPRSRSASGCRSCARGASSARSG